MGKPEAKIEDALVKRIEAIGGLVRKAQWIGRRGCPDRFVMLPEAHRVYLAHRLNGGTKPVRNPWVECKAPDVDAEDHQLREHRRMRARGELVLIVDSLVLIDQYFPLELP